ncbi:acyl-CoA thioesterase [Actinotalea sp. BY-33]|uniref:Acyl-CoA thioesterase n=1 Tax=Actinotalea soli TaxID=2819234 RepID=A0A939RVY8_9CELL|nr:thioesterase family protein [Actinotalea soli]MBO1751646.1 acyl-CoA thioesterase [Actinotalea soli]
MSRLNVPVAVRWADLDAYGHVNNVAVLRLLEEARIAAFWRHAEARDAGLWPTAVLDAGPGATTHTLVARSEIEYLLPLGYRRDPVTVEMWIGHLGGASLDVCYQVTAQVEGTRTVYVHASTTLVLLDATTGRPRRIDEVERAAWEPYLEEPVPMRRRSPRRS